MSDVKQEIEVFLYCTRSILQAVQAEQFRNNIMSQQGLIGVQAQMTFIIRLIELALWTLSWG